MVRKELAAFYSRYLQRCNEHRFDDLREFVADEVNARRRRAWTDTLHPGVPHAYDALAFDADVALRAQAGRVRVLRSL